MAKKNPKNQYWGPEQEEWIANYQQTRDEQLYVKKITPLFKELIKNIYLTYNFKAILKDYETTEQDMLAFLFEKIDKFDPKRGTKSFSYFGTVVKNWMIQTCNKVKKNIYIDDENSISVLNNLSITKFNNDGETDMSFQLVEEIRENIMSYSENVVLDEDDSAIIQIILEILSNYEKVDIYNKKQLYVYIREVTNLPTRKITNAINKMRVMYDSLKEDFVR